MGIPLGKYAGEACSIKKYDGPVCYHLMGKNSVRRWVPVHEKENGAKYSSYPSAFQYQPEKAEKAGPVRYGDLLIDLDCKDNPGMTLIEAQKIISHFEFVFDIDPSQWRFWLSGGKGVHLCLASTTLGADDGHIFLMRGYKLLMAEVAAALGLKTIDTSIYKQGYGQPFRRENVQRENDRYKVPITYDMLWEDYTDLEPYTHEPQQINVEVTPELEFSLAGKMAELLKTASQEKAVESKPLSSEQLAILKNKVPACIAYLVVDDSEPDSLCRDFNRISMVLISYCLSISMDISATLDLCQPFTEGYSGSSSCDTPQKRLENFSRRFHSMNGEGYQFDCSYVLGLKCTGTAFECSNCEMTSGNKETSELSNGTPEEILMKFAVSQGYVDGLGKERFIYPDLIVSNHILTIIAMSGGGKTAFFYNLVAPHLTEEGLKVWYIDADSPASEHKQMKQFADEKGFKFLIPDVNQGLDAKKLIDALSGMADKGQRLDDYVFFLDTLKKFCDLMNKTSIKAIYTLMRRLTKLGATVVLLGHANKYRGKDGNLIFEGTGDVRSDSDELIFFEHIKKGFGIDVTTVVDSEKGAKVRGIFKPFSFHIDEQRNITFYEKALEVIDRTQTTDKATDAAILNALKLTLFESKEPLLKNSLSEQVSYLLAAGQKRVRKLLTQNASMSGSNSFKIFTYSIGEHNRHHYQLEQRVREHLEKNPEEVSSLAT